MIDANEINSTFYALRLLSHGLDTSQIEATDGEEYPASEFNREEQEQALRIIHDIERLESVSIHQLSQDQIDRHLTILTGRIERLAYRDLVNAGYVVEPTAQSPAESQETHETPFVLDQRVQRVMELMRENLHKELSLDEFAQSVNLSVRRLCHIFKAATGLSPINYLRLLRLEKAGSLLETSFLSVNEIAHAVGINDLSHFVRNFKTVYGVTPTRYRMLLNAGQVNESSDPEVLDRQSKVRKAVSVTNQRQILQRKILEARTLLRVA